MTQKLIRMARQISDFFRSQPGEDAAQAIARHINAFWPVTMRKDLCRALEDGAPADPLVKEAAKYLHLPDSAPKGDAP